jgi:hypothetical protein
MKASPKPGVAATPSKQLSGFIAKFDPAVARLIRTSRRALRARMPTAVEIVYDNYNALAIGFGSTDRVSDVIVSLAAYARGVNLYFMYGARLPDPQGLLKGSGNQGRHVPLQTARNVERPEVEALLDAAVRHGKVPLPAGGRGRLVIKSVSAKQRPRRPAGKR